MRGGGTLPVVRGHSVRSMSSLVGVCKRSVGTGVWTDFSGSSRQAWLSEGERAELILARFKERLSGFVTDFPFF
jgi:hypothetical protein